MQALGSTLVWGPPLLFCLSPMYVDHQTQADESSCLFGLTWSVVPGRPRGLGEAAGVYGESSGRLGQGKPAVFLVCLCWLCQPPQGVWKQSAPALSLRPHPWSPHLHTQCPARCRQMWAHELLLSWEVPFSTVFMVNFLRFAFRAHVSLFSPLRFQSFSDPSVRGFPMCGNLLSSCLPSPGFSYSSQNHLSPFSLPNSNEIDLPFWKSEVLCQHSKDVLWELFYM